MSKKVFIVSSSPRKNGNSDILAESFYKGVIESGYDNLMSYKHVVAYLQAALVLKTACRIYENVFADSYVFAAIGIKRRKKPERAVDFTARQL